MYRLCPDGCAIPGKWLCAANAIVNIRLCEFSSDANELTPKMFIDWSYTVVNQDSQKVLHTHRKNRMKEILVMQKYLANKKKNNVTNKNLAANIRFDVLHEKRHTNVCTYIYFIVTNNRELTDLHMLLSNIIRITKRTIGQWAIAICKLQLVITKTKT